MSRTPLLSALALLLCAAPAVAQPAPVAPLLGWLPVSTRALAMGGAAAAVPDAAAVLHNPALLASARGLEVGAQRYGRGATLGSLAGAIAYAPGGLGFGIELLDQRAPCAGCAAALPTREADLTMRGGLPASGLAATLGFGRTVHGVQVGASARYVEQRIPDERDGTLAADVGAAYDVGPVTLGLTVHDIGGTLSLAGRDWSLPRRATLGAAVDRLAVGPFDLGAAGDVSLLTDGELAIGGGAEIGYTPLDGYTVAGRVGLRHAPGGDVGPLSLGAMARRDRIALEYAWQPLDGGASLHRIGLLLLER